MSEVSKLAEWRAKVDTARQDRASLEGRRESLKERAVEIKATMQEEFGVKTPKALDKKIVEQEAKIKEMSAELEQVFSEGEAA